jgi:hypothetical protein
MTHGLVHRATSRSNFDNLGWGQRMLAYAAVFSY